MRYGAVGRGGIGGWGVGGVVRHFTSNQNTLIIYEIIKQGLPGRCSH